MNEEEWIQGQVSKMEEMFVSNAIFPPCGEDEANQMNLSPQSLMRRKWTVISRDGSSFDAHFYDTKGAALEKMKTFLPFSYDEEE